MSGGVTALDSPVGGACTLRIMSSLPNPKAPIDGVVVPTVGDEMTPRFGLGVSREVWLVQIGVFLNALGWGAVLPFEVIYVHDGRGFTLGTAGLVVGTGVFLAHRRQSRKGRPVLHRGITARDFNSRETARWSASGLDAAAWHVLHPFLHQDPTGGCPIARRTL